MQTPPGYAVADRAPEPDAVMPKLPRRKGESKSANAVRTEVTAMKKGQLHSGSKHGPKVTNRKQAIAIGLSEARRAGKKKK